MKINQPIMPVKILNHSLGSRKYFTYYKQFLCLHNQQTHFSTKPNDKVINI